MHTQTKSKKLSSEARLHLTLPSDLLERIAKAADDQFRTTVSLIRQVLAEKFPAR